MVHHKLHEQKRSLAPPLSLAQIAALTPPDFEVSISDENISAVDLTKDVDLVGITTLTQTANRAYAIADSYRARGVKVVIGGIHASVLPEEAAQHADAVVIGEAEGIWATVIEDFKSNNLKQIYRQDKRPDLVNLPIPRRDLLNNASYLVPQTLITTRGCPYNCSFCSVTTFMGHTYRCRPIEDVLKEIETFNPKKPILFLDDNITGNPKFAKELFRALIPYKINWVGQCSVTIAKDDELMKLAADSGCMLLAIGFESISPTNLTSVGKKAGWVDKYADDIKKIHSYGIGIHGFFIFGFDEEKEDVFDRTLRFAQKMKLESAQFSLLRPYPGTALYESLDKEGRLLTKDWSEYKDGLVFEPKSMPKDKLEKGQIWTFVKFYSLLSTFKRLGLFRHHGLKLWAVNLYYRSHWKKKARDNKNQ
jgi:radical SAM superfamily enzyme YgiQ (UPF0313 family)